MSANYYYDAIDLNIQLDASSRLPLLSEEQKILNLVINYLALPYSVAEYGCGKKCSMIIHQLYSLGIPAYAIKRGMIMEKDMSPEMLAERNYHKRKHALTVENSFYHRADFNKPVLISLFNENNFQVDVEKSLIYAGDFVLSNKRTLQFVEARSHIFTILTFWDEKNQCVRERVIDPTIDAEDLFLVSQLRKYLHASESLIFTAPLMGEFELDEKYLTEDQRREYFQFLQKREYHELSRFEKHQLILSMNKADKGSIGDPVTWTYANNMAVSDQRHHEYQLYNSGLGNSFRDSMNDLIKARENLREEKVIRLISDMQLLESRLNLDEVLASDALWSEKKMEWLKVAVNIISDHIALEELNERIQNGLQLQQAISDHRGRGMNRLFGISFRLRERLEDLAFISKNPKGQIDAQALNGRYNQALVYTIRQMEAAGLKVFVDQVGNAHGLFIDDETFEKLQQQPGQLADLCRNALCFGSHIDTVTDGGKYDGRLGVVSGIEAANVLHDLQRFYGHPYQYPKVKNTLVVSVFTGEEMSFTGASVSMPGSSAVTGNAKLEAIYAMRNQAEESYRDCLLKTFETLKESKDKGEIHIANDLSTEQPQPEAAFDPTLFYAPNSLERHIEQGAVLHRQKVPLVVVDTIMGIHQQDFHLTGENAEEAALALNAGLRKLTLEEHFEGLRATVGILKSKSDVEQDTRAVDFGMRWILEGMKNHAGSTLNQDRKDAGVAISRLAQYFVSIVDALNEEHHLNLQSIVGAPTLLPGQNRNVIPGEAAVSLGVRGEVTPEFAKLIQQKCMGFVTGTLALDVKNGGEGLEEYSTHEMNYVNKADHCNMSLDVRFPDAALKERFLTDVKALCEKLENRYAVEIQVSIEQELDAVHLSKSGQVLQLERSYGGSHNPYEAELARDVLRGSLLQLAVAMNYVLEETPAQINLFDYVKKKVPAAWQKLMPSFASGALHDTCNIANSPLQKRPMESIKEG